MSEPEPRAIVLPGGTEAIEVPTTTAWLLFTRAPDAHRGILRAPTLARWPHDVYAGRWLAGYDEKVARP